MSVIASASEAIQSFDSGLLRRSCSSQWRNRSNRMGSQKNCGPGQWRL